MKKLTIMVDDDQYDMIMRTCNKRKKSFRSLVLRMFYDLDFKDQKRKYESR